MKTLVKCPRCGTELPLREEAHLPGGQTCGACGHRFRVQARPTPPPAPKPDAEPPRAVDSEPGSSDRAAPSRLIDRPVLVPLLPGETVLVSTGVARRHIAFCATAIALTMFFILLPTAVTLSIEQRDGRAETIGLVAIIVLFAAAIAWLYASAAGRSRYFLTDKRVLGRSGILTPTTTTLVLEAIVGVELRAHLLTPITRVHHVKFTTVDRGLIWLNIRDAREIEQLLNTLIAGRPQDVRRRQAATGDDVVRRN